MNKSFRVGSYISVAVLVLVIYYLISMNWPRGEYATNVEIQTFANRHSECPEAVEEMKASLNDGTAITKIRLLNLKEKCLEEFRSFNKTDKFRDIASEQLRAFEGM